MNQNTIREHVDGTTPLVSVCPITYNHAKYFSQAIESVLLQKTNFEFEVIVGEDESSDGTREIALDFQHRFPDKLKVLLHNRKDVLYVNGRPTGRWNFVDTISHARGKYIALLPCDDFWTDPEKLQKQVDVMEAHPEYSVCGHWVENVDEDGELLVSQTLTGKECPEIFSVGQALQGPPVHTSSWLFRRFDLANHPQYSLFLKLPAGDDPLMLILLDRGLGYCIRETMSAYRLHTGGTWSTKEQYQQDFEMLQFRVGAMRLVNWRYIPQLIEIIYNNCKHLFICLGREMLRNKSLIPVKQMLKLFSLQETMKFCTLVLIFMLGLTILPVRWMLHVKRRVVNKLRLSIGGRA